jgi:hypothetical protein
MNVLLQALERQGLVIRPARAPAGRALPAELTARGRRRTDPTTRTGDMTPPDRPPDQATRRKQQRAW